MAQDRDLAEIVHAGASERAVGGGEARRLDDVRPYAETGGKAENRPRILWNVGLEQRDLHGFAEVVRDGDVGRNLRGQKDLCDFWSLWHGPTCTTGTRVPIKRR